MIGRTNVGGGENLTQVLTEQTTKLSDLETEINKLPEATTLGTKEITENGTYNAVDDGVDGYSEVTVNVSGCEPTADTFLVRVVDYDGTILKSANLSDGGIFTLPEAPTHDRLVFEGWSSPVTITDNTVTVDGSDITIGPMYHTASGLSEFDITLTKVTGLTVTFNMNGTKDWGDGTSNTSTRHTYADYGDYMITCSGTTMTTSSSAGLFGQSSSNKNYTCRNARFPSSVIRTGYAAFMYCYNLNTVTVPFTNVIWGSQSFVGCSYLISIVISPNSSFIPAFQGCSSLTSITIPNSVTSIGYNAFIGCSSLTSITIPNSVTSIGYNAFIGCSSLTSITIPNSVTSIGDSAFNNCINLHNIEIPESVTSISNSAFSGCSGLTSITIPNSVTSIGRYAFEGCSSLTSITIPNSVTSIGNSAFSGCSKLATVHIESLESWFNISLGGLSAAPFRYAKHLYFNGVETTEIIIPNNVSSLNNYVFSWCTPLTSITIPNSVTSIGSYAFNNCINLHNIEIPESVTSIGDSAFSENVFTSFVMPKDITEIGAAFDRCYHLITYDFSACTSVPTLASTSAFAGINGICKMLIPSALLSEWQTATNWSTYANYMVGV